MTSEVVTVVVAVLALVSSVGGVIITQQYTVRATRRAQAEAARVNKETVDAGSFTRARENYEAALAENDRRFKQLRDQRAEDRAEHDDDMNDVRRRMDRIVRDQHLLMAWSRQVVRLLRERRIPFDPPPIDLGETDPQGTQPIPAG